MHVNLLTGEVVHTYKSYPIFPAYDHASTRERIKEACETIGQELEERLAYFEKEGKLFENQGLRPISDRIKHVTSGIKRRIILPMLFLWREEASG